jgi:adenosylcobinamide-GDP ribazoletransferase
MSADPASGPVPRAPRSRSPLAGARAAFGFLTRLPVGRLAGADAADLPRAAAWFPVVGLAVGGISAGLRLAAGTVLAPDPSTVIALAGAVLVTGGLHEDGLADTADAVGAHVDRARRLEILRDPRIGTFGGLALGLSLLFAYAALVSLSEAHFVRAVVVAHVLARCSPLWQARLVPPARPDGLGALMRASIPALVIASAIGVAVAVGIGLPVPGAVALGAALLSTGAIALLARRKIGGTTGDTFGAGAKLVEIVAYGVFAAFWS